MYILKTTMLATTLVALIVGGAWGQDLPAVAEIKSTTDLGAIQNEEAASYWATLDADLEAALAERLVDRLGEEGLKIEVNIDELELANAFEARIGLDHSLLSGEVRVSDPARDLVVQEFTVTATAQQLQPLLPADADITVLPADTPEFYETLVNAFADGVVENIDG